MAERYEIPLKDLQEQIQDYSPGSVAILDSMAATCGTQTAFYAAFIMVCLHAHQALSGSRPLNEITAAHLKEYSFFESVGANQEGLDLFDTLLTVFIKEHSTTRQLDLGHTA